MHKRFHKQAGRETLSALPAVVPGDIKGLRGVALVVRHFNMIFDFHKASS